MSDSGMDAGSARLLAFRFMMITDLRADAVFALCRRALGFRGRQRCRVVWSDAFELLAVLIADSPTFAAGIARRVEAAERRARFGAQFGARFGHVRDRETA